MAVVGEQKAAEGESLGKTRRRGRESSWSLRKSGREK